MKQFPRKWSRVIKADLSADVYENDFQENDIW